jgi:hypothetical protein
MLVILAAQHWLYNVTIETTETAQTTETARLPSHADILAARTQWMRDLARNPRLRQCALRQKAAIINKEPLANNDAAADISAPAKEQAPLDKRNDQESGATRDALRRDVDQRKAVYEDVGNYGRALALESLWLSRTSHDILSAVLLGSPTKEQQETFNLHLQVAMAQLAAIRSLIRHPDAIVRSLVTRIGTQSVSIADQHALVDLVRAHEPNSQRPSKDLSSDHLSATDTAASPKRKSGSDSNGIDNTSKFAPNKRAKHLQPKRSQPKRSQPSITQKEELHDHDSDDDFELHDHESDNDVELLDPSGHLSSASSDQIPLEESSSRQYPDHDSDNEKEISDEFVRFGHNRERYTGLPRPSVDQLALMPLSIECPANRSMLDRKCPSRFETIWQANDNLRRFHLDLEPQKLCCDCVVRRRYESNACKVVGCGGYFADRNRGLLVQAWRPGMGSVVTKFSSYLRLLRSSLGTIISMVRRPFWYLCRTIVRY